MADLRPVEPRLVPGFMQPVPIVALAVAQPITGTHEDHRQLSFSDPAQPSGSLHRHGVRHLNLSATDLSDGSGLPSDRLNALTPEMWRELREIGEEPRHDTELRALVVIGEGCAFLERYRHVGSPATPLDGDTLETDRAPRAAMTIPPSTQIMQTQDSYTWLEEAPYAMIAAARGYALRCRAPARAGVRPARSVRRGNEGGSRSSSSTASSPTSAALGGSHARSALWRRPRSSSSLQSQIDADEACHRIGLTQLGSSRTPSFEPTVQRPSPTAIAAQPPLAVEGAKLSGQRRRHRPGARRAAHRSRGPGRLPPLSDDMKGKRSPRPSSSGRRATSAARARSAGRLRRPGHPVRCRAPCAQVRRHQERRAQADGGGVARARRDGALATPHPVLDLGAMLDVMRAIGAGTAMDGRERARDRRHRAAHSRGAARARDTHARLDQRARTAARARAASARRDARRRQHRAAASSTCTSAGSRRWAPSSRSCTASSRRVPDRCTARSRARVPERRRHREPAHGRGAGRRARP